MFRVDRSGDILNVHLNINHKVYDCIKVIEDEAAKNDSADLRRAAIGLEVLLLAWARMEDEINDDDRRMAFQDTGTDWGRLVQRMLRKLPE